jgi:hypothetical protein
MIEESTYPDNFALLTTLEMTVFSKAFCASHSVTLQNPALKQASHFPILFPLKACKGDLGEFQTFQTFLQVDPHLEVEHPADFWNFSL